MLRTLRDAEIPAFYIKPQHLRQEEVSSSSTLQGGGGRGNPALNIPIVDLASDNHLDLVAAIGKACEWGFFHIVNHGVSSNLMRTLQRNAEEFLALPLEEKLRCTTQAKVTGPIHYGGGTQGDWRDVLKILCAPPSAVAMEYWPRNPVSFRETLKEYVITQEALVRKLFGLISESLGLNSKYIEDECVDPRVLVAINHYPPCPDPSLTMGIREHSDPNSLTVLLQDEVGGLQVQKDGAWFDVEPLQNALVVNVGDHMQILTNGRYRSCLHRVVNNKTRPRTSAALFVSPSLKAHIKPAPALVDDEHPALYREFIYQEFLKDFYKSGGPNKKVVLSKFQSLNGKEPATDSTLVQSISLPNAPSSLSS